MKVFKVIGLVLVGIIALTVVMAGFGMIGLKQARTLEIQSVNLSEVSDGVYTGVYDNARWSNTVKVTVKDHKIISVDIIKSGNSSQIMVLDEIISTVIDRQQVDIDTVSGATATTNSLLKAIENALE